jgi:hypothetical protein
LRVRIVAAWLLLLASLCPAFASEHTVSLLLTPRLVRRLTRDQTRQTVRWQNFEKRVQTVPDSPERGFELALYYV